MAFPPQFLDEIRARISLADLIGKRVRLVRKGREHQGLCPFHNEKTPSFTVSEEKGFFHCFGCGAHGDAVGFVMQTEGMSFPEAVERLAQDAGLEVPQQTPAERQRAQRQAGLIEVMEAACAFYEASLRTGEGRGALDYLHGRGLEDSTIAEFRLGYAPERRGALKSALMGDQMPESLLLEAGLLGRSEDRGDSYERFRGRVTFPIADRRGRVIAFGARTLGDGQPKYLNSPDTPLFNKGQVLYGLAQARRPAQDRGRVVVTEGYMDVIALAQAGIAEAVAPLGTALTESQIHELWRLADEPLLCFDGDDAGRRAAARAAERALPMLVPGKSLRFVGLPRGEDPDTLVSGGGARAFEALLDGATSLADLLWAMETEGQKLDSPDRVAALEARLDAHAGHIGDRTVQASYRAHFRNSIWTTVRGPGSGRRHGGGAPARAAGTGFQRTPVALLERRRQQVVLATILNHPGVLDEFGEILGKLNLKDPKLDNVRQEILLVYADRPGIDSAELRRHLCLQGHEEVLGVILSPDTYVHAGFARPEATSEDAGGGLGHTLMRHLEPTRQAELQEAEKAFADDPTDENWTRFEKLMTASQLDREAQDSMPVEVGDRRATAGNTGS